MPGPGAILREIHRLRRNAKDLSDRLEAGPRQLKAQHAAVARAEENLKKAQEELKHLKVKAHQQEVSLKSATDQTKKYEKQLNDIMSKKEYDALKHELATTRGHEGKLEDEILALLTQIEERQAKIPELEKALAQIRAQAAEFEQQHEARVADLARQRREVLKQLADMEATLPEEIRPQYDRLIASKGQDAMSAVEGKTCVACYTEITTQSEHDLRQSQFILCKSCGRILYLPE
jgi:predicted  nucleic acid-binding Zn-ribbon protein